MKPVLDTIELLHSPFQVASELRMVPQNELRRMSDSDWNLLQDRADRFAEALRKGAPVDDWYTFVNGLQPIMRTVVLQEMVKVHLDYCWTRGEKPLIEEYCARYAEIGDADTIPVDLICEEYRIRRKQSDNPDVDEYQGRFPTQFSAFKKELEREQAGQTVGPEASANLNTIPFPSSAAATQAARTGALPVVKRGADNYEKTELLGHGNFGEVWKAKAPGGIEVAIKVVTQPIDRDAAQRELKSLDMVKNLRHPCLLSTHLYWFEDDHLHIAMELADGSLRDRFKQCRKQNQPGIPLSELLMYFADAAEGLDFLHTRNVFHRDIKPDNILLLHGHGKVADFGLARLQEKQMATVSFAGTPVYMAPEAWGGKGGPRSDQYSLAFAYTELRQGRRPIEGSDFAEVMVRTQEGELDLADIPNDEAKILRRALAKNPEDRFANCSEFIAAIARATGNPVRLRTPAEADLRKTGEGGSPDSATFKESYTGPLPEKKKRGIGKLAPIFGLLIGGAAFAVWFYVLRDTPKPTPIEVAKTNDGTKNDGNKQVEPKLKDIPPKEKLSIPEGFSAVAGAAVKQIGERKLPERIEYKLKNGGSAVFVLLTPPGFGKPYYMMQTKVSNGFFAEFAEANPAAVAKTDWRRESPAKQPATRVSAAEAYQFARWLGGSLPTTKQWDYATGIENRAGREGPSLKEGAAVGRSEPRSIDEAGKDESSLAIRDMAGNGREWTRDILMQDGSTRESSLEHLGARDLIILRGRNFTLAKPLTYADLEYEAKVPQTQFYSKTSPYTTFRVVVEVPD